MVSLRNRLAFLTPLFAVVTLPLGILAAIFMGGRAAAVVFVVGWLLFVPASAILFGGPGEENPLASEAAEQAHVTDRDVASASEDGGTDPIEEVRQRYARGDIDEVELERRLEALLETEDVDPTDEAAVQDAAERIDSDLSRESSVESSGETLTEEN